jgi:YfiH family protein
MNTILPRSTFIEPDWPANERVRAITTTRAGGYSSGPWSGLNVATHVGDESESVTRNRAQLVADLALEREPVWLNQTHSSRVIDAVDQTGDRLADGSVSRTAGIVCAVMTADCLPLFLSDVNADCVAVLHVGWRGLARGIIESGIKKMGLSPDQVLAWSGPAIGPDSFEIGQEVRDQLGGASNYYCASDREGYYLADLYGLVDERLRDAGIAFHGWYPCCTLREKDRFFSYRRDGITGRMASLIWLAN